MQSTAKNDSVAYLIESNLDEKENESDNKKRHFETKASSEDADIIYVGKQKSKRRRELNENLNQVLELKTTEVIVLDESVESDQLNDEPEIIELHQPQPSPPQLQPIIIEKNLNEVIYEYPRENPKIRLESGHFTNCRVNSIVSLVNPKLTLLHTDFFDLHGGDLLNQLSTYNPLLLVPDEKIYQIAITIHNASLYFNKLFHCCIDPYDYSSDASEISFKSLIRNILKLVNQFDCQSIGLPVCYWLERDYPSYLLVRWFDEAINDFLISNTNHSLKNIAIVLDSEKEEFLKYLQVEKSMMLSRSLSLCNEYKLDDLDLNSNEFKFICKHFGLTMRANEFFINKVQRVSNPFLKHMYSSIKESTRINNPKNTQLEYKLFHGTDMNTIIKICKSGFNRSFCGKNGVVFGCGVYFARDARYSHTYSAKSHSSYPFSFVSAKTYNTSGSNNYCMILSRVIVGMYERGSSNMKDTNLRKDNSQHQYDSTVDNEHNPTIFVIYKDFQALPEYLIHYSKS